MISTFLLLTGMGLLTLLAAAQHHRNSKVAGKRLLSGAYLSLATLLLTFAGLEIAVRFGAAKSDWLGFTMANQRWNELYWKPLNRQGFRDQEWETLQQGHHRLTIVGDSFVAGVGIESISDRFAEKTARLLGSEWTSTIVAQPGWNTRNLTASLRSYPLPSSALILSYYVNDIYDALSVCGRMPELALENGPKGFMDFLQSRSATANLLYWRYWRKRNAWMGEALWNDILTASADPACKEIHQQDLLELIKTARSKSPVVVAVLFPDLLKLRETKSQIEWVSSIFAGQNVPVVDLTALLESVQPSERVVSMFDHHPSLAIQSIVARQAASTIADTPAVLPPR